MRIALVGPSGAGKSTLARQLADYIGRNHADCLDVDDFVAGKWQLPAPGLRRLWLLEQSQLPPEDRGLTADQLVDRRESEFQKCLDGLAPDRITVIAMSTYAYRNNAANFPADPQKQWWSRFEKDTTAPETQTYALRLVMKAEDVYLRLRARFEQQLHDYPDMAGTFSRWAEKTMWSDGVLLPRRQAIRDLRHNQIFDLVPHYWRFPYLTIAGADQYVTPQAVLTALALPSDPAQLVAMLPDSNRRPDAAEAAIKS